MKKKSYQKLLGLTGVLAIAATIGLTAGEAGATNGYFAHGYSIKSKAMAGAGVALPLDSLAAASNPAAMVDVGKRIDVGVSLFNPNREYKTAGATGLFTVNSGQESDSNYFVVPAIGANWMLESGKASIGVSIYGNGGMNTDYPSSVFGSGLGQPDNMQTGVDLMQLFIAPTYARRLNDAHSFGITPIFAYQRFEATGLAAFDNGLFTSSPGNVTNNGYEDSTGFGVRVGYLGKVSPKLSIGAAYQSKIYMSELDMYKGLFAEQGDFDIPANWTIGAAVKTSPNVTVAFDVQHIIYSDVNSVANPIAPMLVGVPLGTDGGAGFGWEDMTIFKLGVQWEQSDDLTLRAGISYGEQPIPTTETMFNIIAPAVIDTHLTFGGTWKVKENQELDFSLMHAFENSVSGANPFNPGQTIEIAMDQWEVSLGYAWKF